ncbi:MAG: hypothetical protein H6839_00300 [Planctomycetes bacterium]|nr:hypothetical protein [Planctomycetota bacterium]
MGYLVLLAVLAAPFGLLGLMLLAMATGVIHEPTPAEAVAHNYGQSWKAGKHIV